MPLRSFLTLCSVLFVSSLVASSRAATHTAQEVLAAEQARVTALTTNDLVALDRIFADDATYTHSSSQFDSKKSYLESIRSGKLKYVSLKHSDQQVRFYGETAILNGTSKVLSLVDGKENPVALRFTLVYVFKEGRWQVVAWQSTRLPN